MGKRYTIFGGKDYHDLRLKHPAVKHSLSARTGAIIEGIKEIYPEGVKSLLDVGGADGLMARGFKTQFSEIEIIYTLDLDFHLLLHR